MEAAVRSLKCRQTVIATGGSVVYSEAAMEHLRQGGWIVYLQLSYEEMMRRLDNIKTRGIVIPEGNTMRDVFDQRAGLYERYADMIHPVQRVHCGGDGGGHCKGNVTALAGCVVIEYTRVAGPENV